MLDEAQERRVPEFLEAEFINLIDMRYSKKIATILITFFQPDAFAENVGESIQRRLLEEGGFLAANWDRIEDIFSRSEK